MQYPPVKEAALAHGLQVCQPKKIREEESVRCLEGVQADVIVVVAFGQLIPSEILHMKKYGCINVHGSLLPKYRGAAPIQWAIIDGEKETGVTTMMMDQGIDTGDMLEKAPVAITDEETGDSLHDKLSQAGARLIISTLKKIEDGTISPMPQTNEGTCYAKRNSNNISVVQYLFL